MSVPESNEIPSRYFLKISSTDSYFCNFTMPLKCICFFLSPNTSIDSTNLATFLPSIVIGCGVIIAFFTYVSSESKRAEDKSRHQSEILFNEIKSGFLQATKLLSDQNNDYVIWDQAANIIKDSSDLKRKIVASEFKTAIDIVEKYTRSSLRNTLSVLDKNSPIRMSLPPTFFYGLNEWKVFSADNSYQPFSFLDDSKDYTNDLHVAATIASGHSSIAPYGEYTVFNNLPNTDIASSSVIIIYSFISGIDITNESKEDLYLEWDKSKEIRMPLYQGALLYIKHGSNFKAIDGSLYNNNNDVIFISN